MVKNMFEFFESIGKQVQKVNDWVDEDQRRAREVDQLRSMRRTEEALKAQDDKILSQTRRGEYDRSSDWIIRAEILEEMGNYKDAELALERAKFFNPCRNGHVEDKSLLCRIRNVKLKLGKEEEAKAIYEQIEKLDPDFFKKLKS